MHYLYLSRHDVIYLVYANAKRDAATLSVKQKAALRQLAAAIEAEWEGVARNRVPKSGGESQ